MRMRRGWEREAGNWGRFTRTPGHDRAHENINLPVLRELLLTRGGKLCGAIVHPLSSAGRFQVREPDAPFVIAGSYADPAPVADAVARDGYRLTFHGEHRPLEAYSRALEAAGLLAEAIREARLSPESAPSARARTAALTTRG
jgi:hypothetical protein